MQEMNETAHKVLDVAERYTQLRGFNAFSYKDLQNEVGVKTSSIHYYFPSKKDLALSMTERYIERFRDILATLSKEQNEGLKRLEALGSFYIDVVNEGKFCLCGMLASDTLSLPEAVNSKLCKFFRLTQLWIAEAIDLAKQQNDIKHSVITERAAGHFLATLEGGMLIARVQQHPSYLADIVAEALSQMTN